MSKNRVVVAKIVSKQLTVAEAAAAYKISRAHLYRLLARYRDGGLDAVDPRPRTPRTNPRATPEPVRQRIIELRRDLIGKGTDAGPVTIAWHLEHEGMTAPAASTIGRILHRAGLVVPEPRKRPRSSYIRFQADAPNQMWQSDTTHWRLADHSDVEILSWLDDHSRYLLSCTAHDPATGDDVVTTFLATTEQHGTPASTLTDNGRIYTARTGGGRNAFEHLLPVLGVQQKNGAPFHPQTQGKVERFHQTLKRSLAARPTPETTAQLQTQLEEFRDYYNTQRPHRALNRRTPHQAYTATPKAHPSNDTSTTYYRVRYDKVGDNGKITLRHAGRLHHLGIGATHRGKRVIALVDATTVTIVHLDTAEILATNHIDPTRNYWRNQEKEPGRWPSSSS